MGWNKKERRLHQHVIQTTANTFVPTSTVHVSSRTRDALTSQLSTRKASRQSRELCDARLCQELECIHNAGLEPYIAAVTELVDYAHSLGILVGPGRSSAPSSLVLYLLGVTQIDPIANRLVFERWFSNPAIEIDVEWHRREALIDRIWERYGAEHAAYVSTYQREKASGQILARDIHAASYVISSRPIKDLMPTWTAQDGRLVVDADRSTVEAKGIGLLTILGMKQLSAVAATIRRIRRTVPEFAMHEIPDEDDSTMDLFRQGATADVFLFGSAGMRDSLLRSQPDNRHDLVALHSVYRPPLIGYGTTDDLIRRMSEQSGKTRSIEQRSLEATYVGIEAIDAALSDTLGIALFQEQFIDIVHRLTGWSLLEAEQFRNRARENGDSHELQDELLGATNEKTTISQEQQNRLRSLVAGSRDMMLKSHAVSYVRIAWMMGYLKTHYPREEVFGRCKQ